MILIQVGLVRFLSMKPFFMEKPLFMFSTLAFLQILMEILSNVPILTIISSKFWFNLFQPILYQFFPSWFLLSLLPFYLLLFFLRLYSIIPYLQGIQASITWQKVDWPPDFIFPTAQLFSWSIKHPFRIHFQWWHFLSIIMIFAPQWFMMIICFLKV